MKLPPLKYLLALLLVLVVTIGLVASLVLSQRSTENRAGAQTWNCGGGTCPDGWSYGPDPLALQSCDARHAEACQNHQVDGVTQSDANPPPAGTGYSQAACESACRAIKGSINGGGVSGRRLTGKNDGGVQDCECFCSNGVWANGYSVCDGGVQANDCTNGTTATREGCTLVCTNGAWVEQSCGGTGSSGGTGGTGGSCGTSGFLACDGEISGMPHCGGTKGRTCQADGTWGPCVNADKCGFQGVKQEGQACNFSSACSTLCCLKIGADGQPVQPNVLASGLAGICVNRTDNPACTYGGASDITSQCTYNNNLHLVPTSGSGAFVGCESDLGLGSSPTKNCYVQAGSPKNGTCKVACFQEILSCGLRSTVSDQTTQDPPPSDPPSNPPTNPPTNPPQDNATFYCGTLTTNKAQPKIGEMVDFQCSAAGTAANTVNKYEFRYRVNNSDFTALAAKTSPIHESVSLHIDKAGTYVIQCRACANNNCSAWETL